MIRLQRETSSTLAAGSLVTTAMMHERGIHGETVCPDLAQGGHLRHRSNRDSYLVVQRTRK